MSLKSLDKLLNFKGGKPLDRLVHRARDMEDLACRLRRALPEIESGAIVAANVRDEGELVVICRSSAWAALLRFHGERMIETAKRQGIDVNCCRIRVGSPADQA